MFQPLEEVLTKISPDIVAVVFQEKWSRNHHQGDIIGFSDEASDSDESIDIIDIKPGVRFLPAAVEGLQKGFHSTGKTRT